MAEGDDLISLTHTTAVQYKAKDGSVKELRVIQPIDPAQRKLEYRDLQLLAKEISKCLREDAL
jgi:hypothetical protein